MFRPENHGRGRLPDWIRKEPGKLRLIIIWGYKPHFYLTEKSLKLYTFVTYKHI